MKQNVRDFIIKNHEKGLTCKAYLYSFYYRFCIDHLKMSRIEKMMGARGGQSSFEEKQENIEYAKLVTFHVNRVTEHMPWKAKCFTRSLTIASLLKKRGIESTIYLGVAEEGNGISAHSWIRCGNWYLTDPLLDKFTTVAMFKF